MLKKRKKQKNNEKIIDNKKYLCYHMCALTDREMRV